MKGIVLFFIVCLSAALADDQNDWINKAETNSEQDLKKWPSAVDDWVNNGQKSDVNKLLDFLKEQVDDSVKNIERIVPRNRRVIQALRNLVDGQPTCLRRYSVQQLLAYAATLRDNKSYYLLEGAAEWIRKRLEALKGKGSSSEDLSQDLYNAREAIIKLRDELDAGGQAFGRALKQVYQLSGINEYRRNINQIRSIVGQVDANLSKSPLLQNARKVNNQVKDLEAK